MASHAKPFAIADEKFYDNGVTPELTISVVSNTSPREAEKDITLIEGANAVFLITCGRSKEDPDQMQMTALRIGNDMLNHHLDVTALDLIAEDGARALARALKCHLEGAHNRPQGVPGSCD